MLQTRLRIVLAVALASAVGAVSFALGRTYFGQGDPAVASPGEPPSAPGMVTPLPAPGPTETIDTSKPGWGLPYLDADKALPRYDQVINGIAVGPGAIHESRWCVPGQAQWVDAREADGTPLALPRSFPAGGVPGEARAVRCGDTIVHTEVTIEFPASPTAAAEVASGKSWFDVQHGGQMVIYKDLATAPGFASQIAAERWEAASVNGLPAALGRAVLRDEFGESAVVVWDERRNLQVVVRGVDVYVDDLLAVAAEALK
ncbi:MAG: hypothetical protein WHT63_00785 [Tepidiforma sp.]